MTRMRLALALCIVLAVPLGSAPAPAAKAITREAVAFTVSNPLDPMRTYTVRGFLVRPSGCATSVLLAMHGLSYGWWAWDFRYQPERYSVAQALAKRGYAMVTVDRLGYGTSAGAGAPDHPNGYTLTVEGYADMTAQIARQLRSGEYQGRSHPRFGHVGLIGHSAGSEIVELAAGLYPEVADVLIPTAYTHVPLVGVEWLAREWVAGDAVRSAQGDYEYFETNPQVRAADMYNLAMADPEVVKRDTKLANLTPSGEIYSISQQPSNMPMTAVRVPILLVLAENDVLFPGSNAALELQHFAAANDKTAYVVPKAGHSFMLHRNAQQANALIAGWLDRHPRQMPRCAR